MFGTGLDGGVGVNVGSLVGTGGLCRPGCKGERRLTWLLVVLQGVRVPDSSAGGASELNSGFDSFLLSWVDLAGSKLGILSLQDAKALCKMFCHVSTYHGDHVVTNNLGKFGTGHLPVLPHCQIARHVVRCGRCLKDLTEVNPGISNMAV